MIDRTTIIAQQLKDGKTYREIGENLGVSPQAVAQYVNQHIPELSAKERRIAQIRSAIGKRFGSLVVMGIRQVGVASAIKWRCDCGTEGESKINKFFSARKANGVKAPMKSCGCRSNETSPVHFSGLKKQRRDTYSRFKGVTFYIHNKMWAANVTKDGHRVHLGKFLYEEDAARAYDQAVRLMHGDKAKTNEDLGLYVDRGPRTRTPRLKEK